MNYRFSVICFPHISTTRRGCISEGNSKDEALKNIKEAVELYLESVEDDQVFTENSEIVELAV